MKSIQTMRRNSGYVMLVTGVLGMTLLNGCGLVGCGGGNGGDSTGTKVLGLVVGETGTPLASVDVSAGSGNKTVSDADGRFTLEIPSSGTVVLVIEKTGMAPAYRQVSPAGAPLVTVGVTLFKPDAISTVNVTSGEAVVNVQDAGTTLTLTFPQGSLVTESGKTPDGPADVAVTWVGPEAAVNNAPVPLIGSDGASTYPLITYGMFNIDVKFNGEACNIVAGKTVKVTVPSKAGDPESAGLFWADTAAGLWKLEGAATNAGGIWTVQIPHLSWWNIDAFGKTPKDNQCCVTFRTRTSAGKPVSGVEIKGKTEKKYPFGGSTEADGTLCHSKFPCGEVITVTWSFLNASSAKVPNTATFTFIPTAQGFTCDMVECQVVDIIVPCALDKQCGQGEKCQQGLCINPNVTPDAITGDNGQTCKPNCPAGFCGDDGCGKPCMECPTGQSCNQQGQCVNCVANCQGKLCGSDGCNGSCGICGAGFSCNGSGQCVDACQFCAAGGCDSFGFEEANPLDGWDVSGDVSIIGKFGGTSAPEGAKMARLSTGLAYAAPSYVQKSLCASAGIATMSFKWRFYSEEFKEYCGSTYQDYFTVSVNGGSGKSELMKVTVDDLCANGDNGCTKCGAKAVGLEKSDISFDKGEVWVTPWQTANLPLPAGADKATIIFEVADVGDSAYDTVVLIDQILLK